MYESFLSPEALRASLGGYADRLTLRIYDTVDSTNTAAKRDAEDDTPALYIARTQTGGRGRLGRSFYSPLDTGLYMTVAYTTDRPLGEAVRITALTAVSAASAIEAHTGKRPLVKWVNDLYLGGCKIAGILCEAVSRADGRTRMVIGIGVNLTTRDFPEGLRAPAASLFAADEASAVTPELTAILAGEITRRVLDAAFHPDADQDTLLADYRERLLYIGERVVCTRGAETFEATLIGVDEDYSLLVETDGEIRALSSGEISVRSISGL